jgi:hypothetical protein
MSDTDIDYSGNEFEGDDEALGADDATHERSDRDVALGKKYAARSRPGRGLMRVEIVIWD